MGANFTDREWEVIRLWADGYNHESAAYQLGVKHDTVKQYYTKISRKLGVNSSAQIVAWFYKSHWKPKD